MVITLRTKQVKGHWHVIAIVVDNGLDALAWCHFWRFDSEESAAKAAHNVAVKSPPTLRDLLEKRVDARARFGWARSQVNVWDRAPALDDWALEVSLDSVPVEDDDVDSFLNALDEGDDEDWDDEDLDEDELNAEPTEPPQGLTCPF